MAHSDFYFENLTGTVRVYLDYTPEDIPPAPEIVKHTLECTSCWGFSGNSLVAPITTIVDGGANDSAAEISVTCVMKKTTYLSILNLFKTGKLKFYDAFNSVLYTVSMREKPAASLIRGVTDEPGVMKLVRCTFKLTVC